MKITPQKLLVSPFTNHIEDDNRTIPQKMKHLELNDPASQTTSTTLLVETKSYADFTNEETFPYDPYKHRRLSHPTSDFETLVHLLKASLGTGILAMPMAFMNAGLGFGLVATFVIGYICTYCIQIWVKCGHILCQRKKIPTVGFSKIAELAFLEGPESLKKYSSMASVTINIALLTEMLGCCCAYNVFVAKSLKQVFEFYYEFNWDLRMYIIFLLPFLIILNLIRSLKYLTPFSMISNILFMLGVTISYYYIFDDLPPISERPMFSSISNLPIFFGTTIFALEGVGVVMPLENNMKNPKHFTGCPGVLNVGMVILVTLYAVTGFFGYWKYGSKTEASITLNLPVDKLLGQVLKITVAIGIFLTYALLFYASMDIIWKNQQHKFKRPFLVEYAIRIFLILSTVAIAVLFPNLGPFLSLIGAFSLSIVGLIFPAIMEILVFWQSPGFGRYNWRIYKNITIAVFGIIGLLTGTMMSIQEFMKVE
uniref:Amino acid transporter transmembrane domain-containing protein n=3 Tax=Clastoptera arizonana TaxID=38151 RepID=A0A1B6E7B9_9HEMI